LVRWNGVENLLKPRYRDAFRIYLVAASALKRRDQRRRGISEIAYANHVSRLVRQPDIDSCRGAGRLLQSQIVLQELRVSSRIGPGQNHGNAAKSP